MNRILRAARRIASPWLSYRERRRRERRQWETLLWLSKPAKPWRVYGPNNLSEDYRSQKAAYNAVKELTGFGHTATVYQWEYGRWVLYEVIEPGEL